MTTSELFDKISRTPEFKARKSERVLKHRHNKGMLSSDKYAEIFSQFGYEKPDKWVKKK